MIVFPNAKINIGLFVTAKRPDGFHNLETVFWPVGLCDILEVNRAEGRRDKDFVFENSGIMIDCPSENNLVRRAYSLLAEEYGLPAVQVHLHKIIPFGAGLGGGSSDAAFMLKALNDYFDLHISRAKLEEYAATLGSDCAFFIRNHAAFATGKGEQLEDMELSLKGYRIVLVKPPYGVSTAEAYAGIVPQFARIDLRKLGSLPVSGWKDLVINDFEKSVFRQCPGIAALKEQLYRAGAVYVSMTGSGSAVFGLFPSECKPELHFPECFIWKEK